MAQFQTPSEPSQESNEQYQDEDEETPEPEVTEPL